MKKHENILVTVLEECAEIQQSVSKALRFGLNNHHPDMPEVTNADDIVYEFYQLSALIEYLQGHGYLPILKDSVVRHIIGDKIIKVQEWQKVSIEEGFLDVQ